MKKTPAKAKRGGKNQDSDLQNLVESETPPPVEVLNKDPYEDLRYQELIFPPIAEGQPPKTKVVPVLKKTEQAFRKQSSGKPLARIKFSHAPIPNSHWKADVQTAGEWSDCLSKDMSDPESLSEWTSVQKRADKICQAIYRTREASKLYKRELCRSLLRESAVLKRYKEVKHQQLQMENHCMESTGKRREDLLLRNKQFLPHLSHSGKEIPLLRQERKVIPGEFSSKDNYGEKSDSEDQRHFPKWQRTKRQRGCSILTQWVGCPEITDEIRNELQLNNDKVTSVLNKLSIPSAKEEEIPCVADIGVIGLKYCDAQRSIRELVRLGRRRASSQNMKRRHHVSLDSTSDKSACYRRKRAPGVDESPMVSRVSLTIANEKLSWMTKSRNDIQQERVIELGCTADIGTSAVNSISMKNTGTAVIHFDWVKRHEEENDSPRRLDQLHLIFDSSGGVILPNEVFRLPFMYKAITRGYYSEDWYLLTKPVLENGAPVILRLWGFSRKFDPYLMARRMLDDNLKTRMINSICRGRIEKIVDYLPLQETALNEIRFPASYEGPELFLLNNSWLNYHSADVYRLGKLLDLINKERVDSERTASVEKIDKGQGRKGSLDESMIYASMISRGEEENAEEESDHGSLWDFSAYCQELDRIWQVTSLDLLKLRNAVPEKSSHDMKIRSTKQIDELIDGSDIVEEGEEDDGDGETGQERDKPEEDQPSGPSKATTTLTNVADPNTVVHSLREKLLGLGNNLSFQEAAFHVMSKTVDRLHFRTAVAKGDWKLTVCGSLLAQYLDKFSEYACFLHQACCLGEAEAQRVAAMLVDTQAETALSGESENTDSESEAEPQDAPQEDLQNIHESASHSAEDEMSPYRDRSDSIPQDCESKLPWMAFEPDRYQNVYRMLLHIRMFQLLSDFCVQMDSLLGDPRTMQVDWQKEGFIRVRRVPWNIDPQDELEKETPPSWIKIAQRIADVKAAIRGRKQEVDEIERLMKEGEKKELS